MGGSVGRASDVCYFFAIPLERRDVGGEMQRGPGGVNRRGLAGKETLKLILEGRRLEVGTLLQVACADSSAGFNGVCLLWVWDGCVSWFAGVCVVWATWRTLGENGAGDERWHVRGVT